MLESEMLEPFLSWLEATRRLRPGSIVATELSWLGKRIDVATLTSSGVLTSYELKIDHNLEAISQAAQNSHWFHRNYVVTATMPLGKNTELARAHGLGVICKTARGYKVIVPAQKLRHPSDVVSAVRNSIEQSVRKRCV